MSQKRIRPHVNPLSITHELSFKGFKNNNPIIVDVGACKGEFAEALIEKFPDKNFILFEIRRPLAERLRQKFTGQKNVAVFDGDAGRNFKSILKPSIDRGVKIEQIFINFPDPWFKEKHKKRRFINKKLLAECAKFIAKNTQWVFQTDQKLLFDETLEVIQKSPFSQIESFDEPPFGIRTDWEQAKTAEGMKIWRMQFKKS